MVSSIPSLTPRPFPASWVVTLDFEEETAEHLYHRFGIGDLPRYMFKISRSLVDYYEIEIEDVIGSVSATRFRSTSATTRPTMTRIHHSVRRTSASPTRASCANIGTGPTISTSLFTRRLALISARTTSSIHCSSSRSTLNLNIVYTRRDSTSSKPPSRAILCDYVGEVGYNEDKFKHASALPVERLSRCRWITPTSAQRWMTCGQEPMTTARSFDRFNELPRRSGAVPV